MEELKVRKAAFSDAAAVIDCVNAAYEKYISRLGKKPGPLLCDYPRLIGEGKVFCGEYAGQIAGILVLKEYDAYLLLDNVAVFPSFQGRGFGKELLVFAEDYAAEKNYQEIRLYTNIKMTENTALYKKLGYRQYDLKHEDGYQRVYFKKSLLGPDRIKQ